MRTSRLEAFSDGVLAIIITIMVLELDAPEGSTLADLRQAAGLGLLTYVLSFVYIGIYWSNHHHLFQLVDRVDGLVLWANLLLLFFLSLYPFTTAWMDQTRLEHQTPVVVYGVNLLLAAVAYSVLELAIFRANGPDSRARAALGGDTKGAVVVAALRPGHPRRCLHRRLGGPRVLHCRGRAVGGARSPGGALPARA